MVLTLPRIFTKESRNLGLRERTLEWVDTAQTRPSRRPSLSIPRVLDNSASLSSRLNLLAMKLR